MQLITLTTDYGWRDPYQAMLKGSLLSVSKELLLVDLSHDIEPYNILQAAFLIKNAYPTFPKKSIHLISVHAAYAEQRRYLIAGHKGHYFIAPDNGLFALLFDEAPELLYELPLPARQEPLEIRQVFAQAVGHLVAGLPLHEIGMPTTQYLQRIALRPIISKDHIRGTVSHIDRYENVVLNIDRALFERVGRNRPFELYFKRYDPLTALSHNYTDVPIGDPLCLFNSAGWLEIAVHLGKAASLFGLAVDEAVQVVFLD